MKKMISCFCLAILGLMGCSPTKSSEKEAVKPNILVIYLDDLGYGDVSAYGQTTLLTPNIDQLANEGVRFTNGYASSATCTPSRYAFLTGIYPWRNKNARILPGDAPLLIDTSLVTLPKMLKKAGYKTAVVGKWHLGIGDGQVDWNKELQKNPNDVGFDYSYIMAATTDRVPTVYIENRKVVGLSADDPIQVSYKENFEGEPTAITNPELMTKQKWHHGHNNSVHNGIPRIGFQKGGKSALWHDEDMADLFLDKAKAFISDNNPSKTGKPFFMYYALQQPHVPRVPNERFVGKSGMGPRGDAIIEADWCVGEIMKQLKAEGLDENTLVIFSSDNGPVLNDGYYDDAVEKLGDHKPAGPLRGGKYSLFDAGTKVPFITYWKGKIKPQVSDALVSQIDILSSIANLVGQSNPSDDSMNMLNALMGKSEKGRDQLVLEATGRLAYRNGAYVLIPPYKGEALNKMVNIETGVSAEYQLYDLTKDAGQDKNLAQEMPEKLEEMKEGMQKVVGDAYQFNTAEVKLK
ncbi:arylsulfatase A-like enzyme [Dyadobacter jejuensis]|uniref:Arylsulfatase A-like enzyme n=1 Tax=Dyadobacter jejuensis TaxID=1082580 RepID=A0A316AH25_9BACT|nr:arylsulfatase [Dyadobacter jejuensis]PWJ56568.1 arylsulfatase A-like enzyme [Dyadobacter jejuensis]